MSLKIISILSSTRQIDFRATSFQRIKPWVRWLARQDILTCFRFTLQVLVVHRKTSRIYQSSVAEAVLLCRIYNSHRPSVRWYRPLMKQMRHQRRIRTHSVGSIRAIRYQLHLLSLQSAKSTSTPHRPPSVLKLLAHYQCPKIRHHLLAPTINLQQKDSTNTTLTLVI